MRKDIPQNRFIRPPSPALGEPSRCTWRERPTDEIPFTVSICMCADGNTQERVKNTCTHQPLTSGQEELGAVVNEDSLFLAKVLSQEHVYLLWVCFTHLVSEAGRPSQPRLSGLVNWWLLQAEPCPPKLIC